MLKYKEAATFWLRAPRFSQIHRTIGDRVFGPFPKVAHPLHEKSAKDGALCKVNKKRTGNLSVSGDFWSKWRDSNPRPFGPEPNALPNCATPRKAGADNGTRTHDLLITNQPLYQLSYIGISSASYYSRRSCICPALKAIFLHFCFVKREKSRKYPHAESIFPEKRPCMAFSAALYTPPRNPKAMLQRSAGCSRISSLGTFSHENNGTSASKVMGRGSSSCPAA